MDLTGLWSLVYCVDLSSSFDPSTVLLSGQPPPTNPTLITFHTLDTDTWMQRFHHHTIPIRLPTAHQNLRNTRVSRTGYMKASWTFSATREGAYRYHLTYFSKFRHAPLVLLPRNCDMINFLVPIVQSGLLY